MNNLANIIFKKIKSTIVYRVLRKSAAILNVLTLDLVKMIFIVGKLKAGKKFSSKWNIHVEETGGTSIGSVELKTGAKIVIDGDSVYRVEGDKSDVLLTVKGASDWRLLYMDSRQNVYVSPHSSAYGSMPMEERGLYRYTGDTREFQKVLSLYSQDSDDGMTSIPNDDTIWSMCEDNEGNLYAGTYSHTVRRNPSIYKSKDGGLTWEIVFNFLALNSEARHIHSISFDPYVCKLYCLVGELNTLYESTDGGVTWKDLKIQTGGLMKQKSARMHPTPTGLLLGSDGAYNTEIYKLNRRNHVKLVYQGWAGTIFGFRRSPNTGLLYAFSKVDASIVEPHYMPPLDGSVFSWFRAHMLEHMNWLRYYMSCYFRFPQERVRPQSAAILVSDNDGDSWKILFKKRVGSTGNYGFWTAGQFVNNVCTFGLLEQKDGKRVFSSVNVVEQPETFVDE